MSNYVRNFDVKNYQNQTTIPQLTANNRSGCFFLKHGVVVVIVREYVFYVFFILKKKHDFTFFEMKCQKVVKSH